MTQPLYRVLLVVVFVLQVAALLAAPVATQTLPPDLQWFADRAAPRTLGVTQVLAAVGAGAWIVAALVMIAGLYRFLPWARPLAVGLTVVALAMTPLFGPTVQAPIITVIDDCAAIAWGAVLAVTYWSPIATRFDAPPDTRMNGTSANDG